MKKRIFSLLLVCSLALTLLPTAFAAGPAYTDYDGNPIPSGYTTSDGTAISVRRLDRSLIWRQLYEGGYLSFIRRDKATGQDISYGLYDLKNDTIYFESTQRSTVRGIPCSGRAGTGATGGNSSRASTPTPVRPAMAFWI